MRKVNYFLLTPTQYKNQVFTKTRPEKFTERETNYGHKTAVEEVLALFNDKNDGTWNYVKDPNNKNIIIAVNVAGECDYIYVVGFVKTSQDRYNKMHRKIFPLPVSKKTERDIFECLENMENKSGYIKHLIRADLAKKIL